MSVNSMEEWGLRSNFLLLFFVTLDTIYDEDEVLLALAEQVLFLYKLFDYFYS